MKVRDEPCTQPSIAMLTALTRALTRGHIQGYHRRSYRLHILHGLLAPTNGTPPRFSETVAYATDTLHGLLAPLLNVAGSNWPTDWAPHQKHHKSLHDIVSYAGWLSVACILSPSILKFSFPVLADRLQPGEENASHPSFLRSKRAALKSDLAGVKTKKIPSAPARTSRVKMVVAPRVARFTPTFAAVGDGQALSEVRHSIEQECLAAYVIYYWGREDQSLDEREDMSLDRYLPGCPAPCRAAPGAMPATKRQGSRKTWWVLAALAVAVLLHTRMPRTVTTVCPFLSSIGFRFKVIVHKCEYYTKADQ